MPIIEYDVPQNELFYRLQKESHLENFHSVLHAYNAERVFDLYPHTIGTWLLDKIADHIAAELRRETFDSLLSQAPFVVRFPQVLAKLVDAQINIRFVHHYPQITHWMFLRGFITESSIRNLCSQQVPLSIFYNHYSLVRALSLIYEMLKKYGLQETYFPSDIISDGLFEEKWPPQFKVLLPESSPQLDAAFQIQTGIANSVENNNH